ncbi:MAG: hypothetical protein GY946_33325 [bacterium]|nr:hypothetical protein [bacterium]
MQELPIFKLANAVQANLAVVIPILLVVLAMFVGYYVLMIRAVLRMLRLEARSVLLVFAFLCLIPFPLVVIYGAIILIVWHFHSRDLLERKAD